MLEQTIVNDYNSFWLIIFTFLTIVAIIIGIVVIKCKDNGLFKNIFNRHSDEHEDTTDKMAKMHDNVIHVKFGEEHEKEFDALEKNVRELQKKVIEIDEKVNLLIERIIKIEQKK